MDEGEGNDWIGELRSFINSQDNVNQEGDDNALPYNSKSIIEPDMQASCTNEDDVYLSRTDVILNNQKLDQSGLRWMSCRKSRCIVCAVNSCHVMSHMRKRDGSLYKLYRMPGSKLKREEWIEAMGNADPDFVPPFTTSTAALQTNFQMWVCERHFVDAQMNDDRDAPSLLLGPHDADTTCINKLEPDSVLNLKKVYSNECDLFCAVNGCFVHSGVYKADDESPYFLYKLPGSGVTRVIWMRALRRGNPAWRPGCCSSYICERHFEHAQSRVPSLFMNAQCSSSPADNGNEFKECKVPSGSVVLFKRGWCCSNMLPIAKHVDKLVTRVTKLNNMITAYHNQVQTEYESVIFSLPEYVGEEDLEVEDEHELHEDGNDIQTQIHFIQNELELVKDELPDKGTADSQKGAESAAIESEAQEEVPSPSKLKRIRPGPLSFKMKKISKLSSAL